MKSILLILLALIISSLSSAQTDDEKLDRKEPESVSANLEMIVPPETFVPSDAFNGYISIENASAIIMTQINNVNYKRVSEGMDEEFYELNQLNFISKESFVSDYKVNGVIYKLWFELKGDRYIRYMVYAGDLSKTLWLNITYPEMLQEIIEMEVLKSINTINLNP
ncbi:hypothetical protein [Brumimicrobium oceani]|uniref:DUF4252 domain-containing protein n=1 Tax=Brumimicrobium oceani TaxID=2100725 RepID=A0A2U2XFU4_9FLAO|nr:hypothetical protein [Brumimicrobium oceani]PWH86633.1 hypothetical protein DIT68_05210 [Brumimicrobium oceani]